jgi:hypothetical protein
MVKIIEYTNINDRLMQMKDISAKKCIEGKDTPLPPPYNRRVPGRTEAIALREAKAALVSAGIWHRRLEGIGKIVSGASGCVMTASDMKGMPDLLACKNGRLIAIEVKAPGGRISSHQWATLTSLANAGAMVCVCVDTALLYAYLVHGECKASLGNGIDLL